LEANRTVRSDIFQALKKACSQEKSSLGRQVLHQIIKNIKVAGERKLPLCQDCGYVGVILEIGQDVWVKGEIELAINRGVRRAYKEGFLRKSIVYPPFNQRQNTSDNTPAFIHFGLVKGDKIKIIVMPKGGGTENVSTLAMLSPTSTGHDVSDFVLKVTEKAALACPPVILGVGIGGSFDTVGWLARKALLRRIDKPNSQIELVNLEKNLLKAVNRTGIGPAGLGGSVTALAVNIEMAATHIACLPIAVTFSCHALRQAEAVI
jgi:fumarate hydratase subunit alpha